MRSMLISFFEKVSKKLLNKPEPKPEPELHNISYSQSGEDLIVKYIFDVIGINNPSYIDVGAHDPFLFSNSALFYKNGSRGVNIEPDPNLFKNFMDKRIDDININVGIAEKPDLLNFYIMHPPTLNTFSKEEADRVSEEGDYHIKEIKKVEVCNINSIIDDYCNGSFPDFLSLDVEGLDFEIIKSIDFNKSSPKVICVETISFSTSGQGIKDKKMIDYIISQGYMLYADTNINTIFVKDKLWRL
jgi:FkbM family methyltransferase